MDIAFLLEHNLAPRDPTLLEGQILGCLINSGGELLPLVDIEADDFSNPKNRKIYEAIRQIAAEKQPIDLATIYHYTGDISIAAWLSAIANAVGNSAEIATYLRLLKGILLDTRTKAVWELAAKRIATGEDAEKVRVEAEKKTAELKLRYALKSEDITDSFAKEIRGIVRMLHEGKPNEHVLYTGVPFFDNLTKGLLPGDYVLLAGRPSEGKTALLLQILISLADHGIRSVFFSKEMGLQSLAIRLMSYLSGRDISAAVRRPQSTPAELRQGITMYEDVYLNIASNIEIYTNGITPAFVAKTAREAVSRGAKIIAFDYIQLIDGGKKDGNRNLEIENFSRSWKTLCKDLGVPGIMLSQLSRACERDSRAPNLSDLRDSGSLEQDADYVIFLHRSKKSGEERLTWLLQEKGRNVGRGYKKLVFFGETQTFVEEET